MVKDSAGKTARDEHSYDRVGILSARYGHLRKTWSRIAASKKKCAVNVCC